MKSKHLILFLIFLLSMVSACSQISTSKQPPLKKNPVHADKEQTKTEVLPASQTISGPDAEQLKKHVLAKYQHQQPREWGEKVTGVKNRLDTRDRVIALTFDACGGKHGSGYDKKLIDYLIREKIPATLFVNSRWIDANRSIFLNLSKNPLFEIENHGFEHKPLSVTGKSVYGIKGTKNAAEVLDEILLNHQKIEQLTGRKPKFFRAGTAYYDEIAVKIANDAGEQVVNFDRIGDAGATYSTEQVYRALLKAKPGSIVILHFNKPGNDTAEGVMKAIPQLKKKGYQFVKLEDYPLSN
ncbi:polysaccharide deacetylase family protein [Paenactinomyces guangxiensis]|uniref:Polysaccharide deacetylase family protein n=1 Tax=Paenactinomyces guangxiensis TaxID=1490290 RepID=A0A7W1WT39_9BACL|nr:polysaccharide deacetylase family protein [Paenactinomyces guangxiensis]MBA4495341.1 polysaccharide deacetylase family protein [Paenactinomyces guangxiensis]MBH8592538.1 polysaccharide deacetylase family protein [Paenactinomyces guangxiensis]